MAKITDAALLAQLNGSPTTSASAPTPASSGFGGAQVTDPALLAQLNGEQKPSFFRKVLNNTTQALAVRPQDFEQKIGVPTLKPQEQREAAIAGQTTPAQDRARRWLGIGQGAIVDLPVAIAQMAPGKTGENIANAQQQEYENLRKQLGGSGMDISRIVGNIVNPVQIKGAGFIDKLLNKTGAGLVKRGAAQGALAGATQPIMPGAEGTTDNLLIDKALQTGGGALFGGVLNKLLGKLPANSLAAQNASDVDKYRAAFPGSDLTWGQNLGGRWNQLEQKMTSFPFVGDTIKEARNKSLLSQNVGMMEKALEPAGINVSRDIDVRRGGNREMFQEAYDKLQDKLNNDILPNIKLENPQALRSKIYGKMETGNGKSLATQDQLDDAYTPGAISNKYNQLSEAGQQQFDRIIENGLFKKFGKDPQGNHSLGMSGKQFKLHEEDLKDTIDDLMAKGGEDRTVAKMLKKSLAAAKDSFVGADGQAAQNLNDWNTAYAGYKVLEKASTASGASKGFFTPAQTVRAAQRGNANRGQVARGKGLLQQDAELSESVLGKHYPDSGTAGRLQAGNPFLNVLGTSLAPIAEALYSPWVATGLLQGGARAKRAFHNTGLGAKVLHGAPTNLPAATRALLSPSGSAAPEEEFARGGAVGGKPHPVDEHLSRARYKDEHCKSVHYAVGGLVKLMDELHQKNQREGRYK